jgi:adenylate kinase
MIKVDALILIGKPGSGKGTQSGILKQKFRMEAIPYGDFFRNIAADKGFLADKVAASINKGEFLPYWMPSYVLIDYLVNNHNDKAGIILDGAARSKEEAIIVHKVLSWFERDYKVIYIDVPDEVVISRLSERLQLLEREDDKPEHIKNRIDTYNQSVIPSIEYFREKGKLITINGNQSMEKVSADILEALQ